MQIFGTHWFQPFFTEENFDNLCEVFIGYNFLVRKMKELLLNKFFSNANEFTTFSMNTILEAHVGFATRSTAYGPLWKSLWSAQTILQLDCQNHMKNDFTKSHLIWPKYLFGTLKIWNFLHFHGFYVIQSRILETLNQNKERIADFWGHF